MVCMKTVVVVHILIAVLAVIFWNYGHKILPSHQPPEIVDNWWAKEPKEKFVENETIRRFKISIPDEVLDDLKTRLINTRFADPLENSAFEYGFNTKYMKEIVKYWLNTYDWRKEEKRLNQFEGYKTQIEGIDIHYLHVKPKNVPANKKVIPLLMIHGWPGSVVEFYKIIPLLTSVQADKNFVFELICPHIPGYGFSEAPHKPGFSPAAAAQIFDKLMQRLGFSYYYSQGGDWGSIVTNNLGILFPQRVRGIHINMLPVKSSPGLWFKWFIGNWLPWLVVDDRDYSKVYPLSNKFGFLLKESGYFHLQATKPDTVGVALGDSPAGLAAYILEKFSTWTSPQNVLKEDGGLTKKFPLNELLTNVMVYWVTGSATSSMRFYKESLRDAEKNLDNIPTLVPTGIAVFPNDILAVPQSFAEHNYFNIMRYTDMPRGGHFSAWEEPELLAADIRAFVETVEKYLEDEKKNKENKK